MPRRMLLFAVVAFAAFASPADAQIGAAKPARILLEAEDFKPEQGGWAVVPFRENFYCSTFAVSFLSRMACLGAPEQTEGGKDAIAAQAVQIPHDGAYTVMTRYELPWLFSVEHTVEIEQGGKVVYKETFGKLEDPKIWPLNGHKRVAWERFFWGATDNIVWQDKGKANLKQGPATVRLIAAVQLDNGKPRVRASRRHIDVVCLTDDVAGIEAQKKAGYLEFDGWLTQQGDVFVRFTNPKDGYGPCVPILAPMPEGQHSPYYIHVRDWPTTHVLRTGRLTDETKYQVIGPRPSSVDPKNLAPELDNAKYRKPTNPKDPKSPLVVSIPDAEYLQPGETSGWVPLGQALDSLNNSQWAPKAEYKGKATGLKLTIEFAIPDGKGGLAPIKKANLEGTPAYYSPVTFEMPGNVAPNAATLAALKERWWAPEIRTQKESLDWLIAEVKKMPQRGSAPKRLLTYNILGFSGALQHFPEAKELAVLLGDNTAVGQEGKKRKLVAHWPDASPEAIKKHQATKPDDFKDLKIVSYGDEIHLPPHPLTDAEWAEYLKAKQAPADIQGDWKTASKDNKHPLHFYAILAAKEKGGKHYAAGTAYYESIGALTGANYSPHSNYLVNEMDYVRPFKMKAMTMPWAEDYIWQIPEFSGQIMGYLTDGLRAGAKYHNLPIHMYVMPHSPGTTPRSFRLSYYSSIAHGAKMINYFCASPSAVGGTENYVDTNDLRMWKAVKDTTHDSGVFEDYVLDAKVRPAKVGLLLSAVDDVIANVSNSTLALHNNERKAIWYALRHAQVPVDFVTEDDFIEGLAKDYQVVYVTQQWMHSKAMAALKKFAEEGGTVIALAGGGFMDEFQKPSKLAPAFYGIETQELTTDPNLATKYLLDANKPFLAKQDLPSYVPIDKATWSQGTSKAADVEVIVWKQKMKVADGAVLGKFSDGSPAVVEKKHGKGRVVLFGFMPGQAYLKSGLPIRPVDRGANDSTYAHFLPTGMDTNLRSALVDAFLPEKFARPVTCSETLVESTCIDTKGAKNRLAVPLMNWTGQEIASLTVRIQGAADAKTVRSVERGQLQTKTENGALVVTLPLAVADMLLIDR